MSDHACRGVDWTSVPCDWVCRRCGRDLPEASEIDRLRARVAELEDELVENDGVIRLLRRHRDSAEARVAELEAAGDRLENAAAWTALDIRDGALEDAVADWRTVRGEGSE